MHHRVQLLCGALAALVLLGSLSGSQAHRAFPSERRQLQAAGATYRLVEYIGTSGAPLSTDDIAKFPAPPTSVGVDFVIAFVGDATSKTTPSGNFACTGGSFCSGNDLDQDLISALQAVGGGSRVLVGLGGANYPTWPSYSPSGYADTAAKSLIAYAKKNNIQGYDLDFENGLNDDWVTQWTSIAFQMEKAGIIVTIDPFSATKQRYGQLYTALQKMGSTGTFLQGVQGINYQAYAYDGNGSPSSEQDVINDITQGDSSAVSEFGVGDGMMLTFGVAPNRPGPESTPPVATNCAGIARIKDIVCPALRDCTQNKCDYSKYWAGGIMVFDFDTEFKAGKFTLVNTAYQALSGQCDSIQKC